MLMMDSELGVKKMKAEMENEDEDGKEKKCETS